MIHLLCEDSEPIQNILRVLVPYGVDQATANQFVHDMIFGYGGHDNLVGVVNDHIRMNRKMRHNKIEGIPPTQVHGYNSKLHTKKAIKVQLLDLAHRAEDLYDQVHNFCAPIMEQVDYPVSVAKLEMLCRGHKDYFEQEAKMKPKPPSGMNRVH